MISSQKIIKHFFQGGFIQYLDPKQGEGRNKLEGTEEEKIEEFKNEWKYRCPFDTCERNAGKGKDKGMGYKVCTVCA